MQHSCMHTHPQKLEYRLSVVFQPDYQQHSKSMLNLKCASEFIIVAMHNFLHILGALPYSSGKLAFWSPVQKATVQSPSIPKRNLRTFRFLFSIQRRSVLGFLWGGKMNRQERPSKVSFPTMARTNCLCPRMVVRNHFGECKERTASFWETMSLWQRLYWKHLAMWYQVLQTYKPSVSRQALPHLVHLPPGGQGGNDESWRLVATMWTKDTIPQQNPPKHIHPWPWPWNASGRQQRA